MQYVELCRKPADCKRFSRLVMGTDHLVQADWTGRGEPEKTEEEAFAVLDEAAKLGINFFDTAPIYVGGVENKLGRWMQSRKERVALNSFYYSEQSNPDRKLYALSKGGFPFDLYYSKKLEVGQHSAELKAELDRQSLLGTVQQDGSIQLQNIPAGTYASRLYGDDALIQSRIGEELGHSTSNLNADITIYLMHRDDNDYIRFDEIKRSQTPVETILGALSATSIASKFWGLGWSNWLSPRVNESVKLANENEHYNKPLINSPYFSLFEMSARSIHAGGVQVTHEEMMDPNFQKGIKIMPYSPLGGFSIFDKAEPVWENAKQAAKEKYDLGDPYWQNVYPAIFTEENQARYARVVTFKNEFNKNNGTDYTLDQFINAYALAHPRCDFLAVGPINAEQLHRTVGALELAKKLTPKDLDFLYSGLNKL